jgi:glycyl-tRNA synthetase
MFAMLNFQEMIAKLTEFWANQGCVAHQGYDLEVGAGTLNPSTFLRCLGPEPYSAVYVEPSRRPTDGRYGENPNRVQFYHQMQVIIKPSPPNFQDLYLGSLEAIGLDVKKHDIRFVHDDWENPTIGAWGLGWEVWSDGMEISQFTYFQCVGGMPVHPVSGEITYGLERLAMYIQGVDSIFDLKWNEQLSYGDIYKRSEWEWSHYNFSEADTAMWLRHFEDFEAEAKRLVRNHFPIPAYDFVLKASHAFNILDARGVISVTERTNYIARVRNLAKLLAESYIESRKKLGFPLMKNHKLKRKPVIPLLSQANVDPNEKQDFLLEIGSEELPAAFVSLGMQHLENQIRSLLKQHELSFDSIETYGTPRRLAVCVHGLAAGTLAKKIERKGPAVLTAFEPDGNPTKAGAGFFRSMHHEMPTLAQIEKGDVAGLEIRKIKDIDYVFAAFEHRGVSARQILAENLSRLILNLDFPKKMRWSDLDIEYARPIRWIIALYGSEVIPFSVGDIATSDTTYGHRQLAPFAIRLSHPNEYIDKLRKHWVMADVKERYQSIEDQLEKLEKNLNGKAAAKERVMHQVLHLVEWPFLTSNSFDKNYLQAPKEVLISEMVEHQKYFPVASPTGDLLPFFIIVCNTTPTNLIRAGNLKALAPRLADGVFLYEEDLKVPLERFCEKLKAVTYQKELGSVWEKVQRLSRIVAILHHYLPITDLNLVQRAAFLCKADLASDLVGEFPELQGVVGKLYALKQGENPQVAIAIDEHWMPRGEKAPIPSTPCGILLSLAEKIDNFISCYALDLKPTSSSDPYALRRQAMGMLKMLIEGKYHLPLHKILKEAFEFFLCNPELSHKLGKEIHEKQEIIINDIISYLASRFRTILTEYGFEKDEIEAVLSQGFHDVYDLFRKIEGLHSFRSSNRHAFQATLEIYTRSKKILFSQNPHLTPGWAISQMDKSLSLNNRYPAVNPKFFKDPSENALFEVIENIKHKFHIDLIDRREPKGRRWREAFALLAHLQQPLESLFNHVKIIDDDPEICANRLALLQAIWDLCEELADFSKIQEHSG